MTPERARLGVKKRQRHPAISSWLDEDLDVKLPNVPDLIRPTRDSAAFSQEPPTDPASSAREELGSDRHGSRDLPAPADPLGGEPREALEAGQA